VIDTRNLTPFPDDTAKEKGEPSAPLFQFASPSSLTGIFCCSTYFISTVVNDASTSHAADDAAALSSRACDAASHALMRGSSLPVARWLPQFSPVKAKKLPAKVSPLPVRARPQTQKPLHKVSFGNPHRRYYVTSLKHTGRRKSRTMLAL